MKRPPVLILILVTTFLLLACNRMFYVDFEKIGFEKLEVSKNSSMDSLRLSFELKIPPKSVGKKSITVIFPVIIEDTDTLKFEMITLAGEGNWDDCMNIPYNYPTTRHYRSSRKIDDINISNAGLKFLTSCPLT